MASPVDQPSEERTFEALVEKSLSKLFTTLPGIVISYDELKRTAVVKPAVYATEPMANIEDVPVLFHQGGGFRMIFPLEAGDEVDLRFSKLDPSRFEATGEVSQANHVRIGGLYACCVPSPSSLIKRLLSIAQPGALCIGSKDGLTDIVLDASGIRLMSPLSISLVSGAGAIAVTPAGVALGPAAADFVALASKVDAVLAALAVWGSSHVHTSSAPGFPTSPPATPPPTPIPTGSLSTRSD